MSKKDERNVNSKFLAAALFLSAIMMPAAYAERSGGVGISPIEGTYQNGTTDDKGGAFLQAIDTVVNSGSKFISNTAALGGGAIYSSADLNITGGEFTLNSSSSKGGAIYNEGTATIVESTFTGNTSTGSAGAIEQKDTSSVLTLNNVSFENNSAEWAGALLARGTVDIKNGGMASIFLMYGTKVFGTPRVKKDTKLYSAIYGKKTKEKIKEIMSEEFRKVLKNG